MGALLILFLRITVPFAILRWPFWGMLAAIGADSWDLRVRNIFDWPLYHGDTYQVLDKLFDLEYLGIGLLVSRQWKDVLARRAALFLFLWRAAGVAVFELTRSRWVLFLFPNVFETFYLLITGIALFSPTFRVQTKWRLAVFLFFAAIPKIIHEYFLHYRIIWG